MNLVLLGLVHSHGFDKLIKQMFYEPICRLNDRGFIHAAHNDYVFLGNVFWVASRS